MARRVLPDLAPEQVVTLQDELLANADALLTSALAVLDLGYSALARSLAILGMEESGKAIAVHERRVAMQWLEEGSTFRCDELDDLWSSHHKKLDTVYRFLRDEKYWFDTEPPDPQKNIALLGSVKRWASKHDKFKQRGFYVDLDNQGKPLTPSDLTDEEDLERIIRSVHQIGWQLRLGEHIEGKRQDERSEDVPPMTDEELALIDSTFEEADLEVPDFVEDYKRSLREGRVGEPLKNAAYRFNPPGVHRGPFDNVGKPGYEAETREIISLAESLEKNDEG